MASLTKLYLRDGITTLGDVDVTGAPGASTLDAAKPDVTASGAATNRTLSAQTGTAQSTASLTTLGQTAAQSGWIRRFVSPALAAQTIGAQSISLNGAFSESNAASDFRPTFGLYLWRPSTSALVATLVPVGTALASEPGTGQTLGTATATSTAGTAADGDVLVLEVWRSSQPQVNTASRTNSIYFDGATEASTTDVAAYVSFATAVTIPTAYSQSLTASLSPTATIGSAYTPAPVVTPGLTAVFTHTE